MTPDPIRLAKHSVAEQSRSFAVASRLLSPACRDDAVVVYAWCRYADDAVNLVPALEQAPALERLRRQLAGVYDQQPPEEPVLAAFQQVVRRRAIPREYPEELLAGMQMDTSARRYHCMEELLLYCYRVAGTVGLMMCHVLGVRDPRALKHGAHLGMAMQLTTICRDVAEDWQRGRLYIPETVLADCGAAGLADRLGGELSPQSREPLACAVRKLLAEAERFYWSGDAGIPMLSWRCGLAVLTARLVYSRIGERIQRSGCDVFAGRAYVPLPNKLALVLRAAYRTGPELPRELRRGFCAVPLQTIVRFPSDILPV